MPEPPPDSPKFPTPEIVSPDTSPEASLLSLVGKIYECAQKPELWTAFLEELTARLKGQAAAMILHDDSRWQSHAIAPINFDASLIKEYNDYYSTVNPWSIRGTRFERTGGVYTGQMSIGDSEFDETEYYRDFLRRTGLFHTINGTIAIEESMRSWVSILRPRATGAFGDPAITSLQMLMPHLQRARELNRDLAMLQGERDAAAGALDRWSQGCFLLDAFGQVILFNRAAGAILEQKDGLSLAKRTLTAGTSNESLRLRMLVMTSISLQRAGGTMVITRPSARRPYIVRVTPLHRSTFDLGRPRSFVGVFVVDPELQTQQPVDELLKMVYGLTRAESALARHLIEGLSMEEAAERLGVTRNTAKTQLSAIFQKTGTRRQSELLRILVTSSGLL